MAQQSSGFSGCVKLGKASTRRAWSALSKARTECRLLAVIGEQPALAARLRYGRDAQATRPAAPAEHLERLQQLVEVAHLERAVVAEQRRERARRRLGAADLEADDGLAGICRARQRRGERVRAPDRLDEQPDRARAVVLGQEADEIRHVARELAPGRDDRAIADARPAGQERLADGPRVRDAGNVPGHELLRARRPCRARATRRRASRCPCSWARRRPRRTRRRARRCARRPRDPRHRPRRPARAARPRARPRRSRPRRPPPRACAPRAGRRTPAAPGAPSARRSTRGRARRAGWD